MAQKIFHVIGGILFCVAFFGAGILADFVAFC